MPSALRSNQQLRRLFAAWAQSCIGTGVGFIGLLLLAIHDLRSSWGVAAVLLADFVPAIAFGALFGAWADRHSRRAIIVGANVLQAGAWAGLAFVHSAIPIVVLALLAGIGNALGRPAMRAALPVVAGDAQQVAAAWFDTARWVGITAGPLIAGGLVAVASLAVPLVVNSVSFILAAALIFTISIEAPVPGDAPNVAHGLRAGVAAALSVPAVFAVVVISAVAIMANSLLMVCDPFLVTRVLHGSGADYGLVIGCNGAGMVAASLRVARRGSPSEATIWRRYLLALLLAAVGLAAAAVVPSVALAMLAFAVIGYGNSLMVVSETQLFQLRVPNELQGRLFGVRDNIEGIGCLIAFLVAAGLVAGIGVRLTLGVSGALYASCLVAAVVVLRLGLAPASATVREATEQPIIAHQPTRRFDPARAAREGVNVDEDVPGASPTPTRH